MADASARTFIGPSITVRGHVQSEEDVVVAGKLIGRIETKGGVTVEAGGTIEAEISSGTLDVFGLVVGPVAVMDLITIHPGGRVEGEIRAPRMILSDGGKYKGNVDTQVQRQEVLDAVLERLNEGPQAMTVTGKPKWGGSSDFGRL